MLWRHMAGRFMPCGDSPKRLLIRSRAGEGAGRNAGHAFRRRIVSGNPITKNDWMRELTDALPSREPDSSVMDAEATLKELAGVFLESRFLATQSAGELAEQIAEEDSAHQPHNVE